MGGGGRGEESTPCMSVFFSFERLIRGVVVCFSLHFLQKKKKKESHIGMPIQHFTIYTVFDLFRKCPLRLTLLNLDRAWSVSDSRSSNYLLKTSQLEIKP